MDILDAAKALLISLDILPESEWASIQEQCAPQIQLLQSAICETELQIEQVGSFSGD